MKGYDVELLCSIKEPIELICAGVDSVKGYVAPKQWDAWNNITCEIFESKDEPRISIPVKSLAVSRDWSDEIRPIYVMGSAEVYWDTPWERARWRALEGLRAYRKTLVACTYYFEAEEDWPDEYMGHTYCGHGPESHGPDGCKKILDYYDWDCPIYCPCEGYQKPAPLVLT